jgi:hypothetical protein
MNSNLFRDICLALIVIILAIALFAEPGRWGL